MLIDAIGTNQTWEVTCGNGHDYKIDLSTIEEIEIHKPSENKSDDYMWNQLSCPECENQKIQKIDLPDY